MSSFFATVVVIAILIVGALILLWAILEMLDLAGYIFPGRKKKKFFDE